MPLELQGIRASEFIRVGTQRHLNLAASKTVLAELAGACRRRGLNRALLDNRDVHPGPTLVFTPQDLAALVDTFCAIGFTSELRLALRYATDPHKRARMFAFLGTLRGWSIRAFGDYETALHGLALSGSEETTPDSPEQPEKIDVHISDAKQPPPTSAEGGNH